VRVCMLRRMSIETTSASSTDSKITPTLDDLRAEGVTVGIERAAEYLRYQLGARLSDGPSWLITDDTTWCQASPCSPRLPC
jgi:hypothetical protein